MAVLTISISLRAQTPAPAPQATAVQPQPEAATVPPPFEDFTSLKLNTSHLAVLRPLPGGHQETATFTRDLVRLQWRDNDAIDLYIIRPVGVKNPPVALYLYSFPSTTERFRDDNYCRRVVAQGAAAVGFVSALTGPRFINRPMKQWFISELQESLAASVHDVRRVGMYGQGSGGAIAILAASADSRIQALDLLSPWGDWPDWLAEAPIIPPSERAALSAPEFLRKVENMDPIRVFPALKGIPIRLQYVADAPDLKAPSKIEAAAPGGTEIIHYRSPAEFIYGSAGGRTFEWLAARLKATPPPPLSSLPSSQAVGKDTESTSRQ